LIDERRTSFEPRPHIEEDQPTPVGLSHDRAAGGMWRIYAEHERADHRSRADRRRC
jgi:hypothetical protein